SPNEHRYIVTIPGRGYRFVAPVRDLGAEQEEAQAARPAPIEELPHQVIANDQVIRSSARRFGGVRRTVFAYYAVIVIFAAASYFLGHSTSGPAKAPAASNSIAVLPFKSLGSEGSDDYLGLAMADALITKLSSIREIPVRPTSSVLKFADTNRDPLDACRELE